MSWDTNCTVTLPSNSASEVQDGNKNFHFKPLLSFEESADNDLRMTEVSQYSY